MKPQHEFIDIMLDIFDKNLVSLGIDVIVDGKSGADISRLIKHKYKMANFKFDGIVIENGSNDLCRAAVNPGDLAADTVAIMQYWVDQKIIKGGVICHVLHRGERGTKLCKWCEKDEVTYNLHVDIYNRCLTGLLANNPNITHWRHEGFRDPVKKMTRDDIHPNTEKGFTKYIHSITGAIRLCRKKVFHIA